MISLMAPAWIAEITGIARVPSGTGLTFWSKSVEAVFIDAKGNPFPSASQSGSTPRHSASAGILRPVSRAPVSQLAIVDCAIFDLTASPCCVSPRRVRAHTMRSFSFPCGTFSIITNVVENSIALAIDNINRVRDNGPYGHSKNHLRTPRNWPNATGAGRSGAV